MRERTRVAVGIPHVQQPRSFRRYSRRREQSREQRTERVFEEGVHPDESADDHGHNEQNEGEAVVQERAPVGGGGRNEKKNEERAMPHDRGSRGLRAAYRRRPLAPHACRSCARRGVRRAPWAGSEH